jgi:hypothetical protein
MAGFFLFSLVYCLILWLTFWRCPPEEIAERREIQFLDIFVFIGILVETLQYISLGPNGPFLLFAFRTLADATALDFSQMLLYQNGGFEIVLISVFAVMLTWVLMVIILVWGLDLKLRELPCVHLIGEVCELMVPLINDWLYLPILSVLFDVYICTGAVASPSFSASYLRSDCFMSCWQGKHTVYVCIASALVCTFLLAGTLFRPLWQEMQLYVNIKAAGSHVMRKSLTQITIILMNKTLKKSYPEVYQSLFTTLIALLFVCSFRTKSYNYIRARFWHRVALGAVLWTAVIWILQSNTEFQGVMWVTVTQLGYLAALVFGLGYQSVSLPSFLYSKSGVDSTVLFRFAFQRTTSDILSELRENFRKVGHRNDILTDTSPRIIVSAISGNNEDK